MQLDSALRWMYSHRIYPRLLIGMKMQQIKFMTLELKALELKFTFLQKNEYFNDLRKNPKLKRNTLFIYAFLPKGKLVYLWFSIQRNT